MIFPFLLFRRLENEAKVSWIIRLRVSVCNQVPLKKLVLPVGKNIIKPLKRNVEGTEKRSVLVTMKG
jgi:hypothetical protein